MGSRVPVCPTLETPRRFFVFFTPWRAGRATGACLGRALFFFLKKERENVYRNLDIVYGNMTPGEKKKFAKENFENYGIGFFEFIKFTLWKPEKSASLVKEIEGYEHFEKAKSEGRGLIGITGHFSNWELIPIYFKVKGFNVGVIGTRLFDSRLDKIVNLTRGKSGVSVFDRDSGARAMLKELKQGMMRGILADQDTRVDSEVLPFLGKDAKTPIGPAVLAKKLGLYLCTLFVVRRKDGYYKIVVNKPFENVKNKEVKELAAQYNGEIGRMIKEQPLQWAWVHERWKSIKDA